MGRCPVNRPAVNRPTGIPAKGFSMPAIKARRMKEMIDQGEFIDWMLRERRLSRKIRRGLPSKKTIGRRLKTIGLQLCERD